MKQVAPGLWLSEVPEKPECLAVQPEDPVRMLLLGPEPIAFGMLNGKPVTIYRDPSGDGSCRIVADTADKSAED